jgi:hypothetical protein
VGSFKKAPANREAQLLNFRKGSSSTNSLRQGLSLSYCRTFADGKLSKCQCVRTLHHDTNREFRR